eukprot:TRINITY_DN4998_c0_g1_i1.p1 TRINITY_DN4998_c0_g1~~TRINITY_DN4998_c0_g1_i1.p1  ORF type:complete len:440 (-),score=45.23 TRINITY_DN4998_c0_g1_i1:39-1358(-)
MNNVNYFKTHTKQSKFSKLPNENILEIFSYLRKRRRDVQSLACVCKHWKELVSTSILHKQVVVSGPNHCLSLTTDDECYVWGDNQFGQLGLSNVQKLYQPRHLSHLLGTHISMLATGGCHNLALTERGKIYAWGRNVSGQLGLGTTSSSPAPKLLDFSFPREVAAITCGASHSLALLMDGRCYSWGFNEYGQLGLGHRENTNKPQFIEKLKDKSVVHIAAAYGHCLVHTLNEESYGWGMNGYGQLGIGSMTHESLPVLLSDLKNMKVRTFCGGVAHSLALMQDGSCYSWGRNDYGQLGVGLSITTTTKPVKISAFDDLDVTILASGWNHCFAIAGHGDCFSWGLNSYGQLGHGNRTNYFEPKLITALRGKAILVVAGGQSHSLALTADGECYSWGANNFGQLGFTQAGNTLNPTHVSLNLYHSSPMTHKLVTRKRTETV